MGFLAPTLVVFDCLSGASRIINKTPFKIGSGVDCDWRIDDSAVAAEHCVIQRKGHTFFLLPVEGTNFLMLDGTDLPGGELALNTDHTLAVGTHLFALHGSRDPDRWLAGMNHFEWFVFDKSTQNNFGPFLFQRSGRRAPELSRRRKTRSCCAAG